MDGGGNLFLVFEGTEKSGLFFFSFFLYIRIPVRQPRS